MDNFLENNTPPEKVNENEILGERSEFEIPDVLKDMFSESESSETETKTESSTGNTSESSTGNSTNEPVNDDDVGVDLMGAMTMLNFGIGMGSSLIAEMFGYDLPSDKMLANDAQLKKLAKAGKPLYEKYLQNKMSAETAFLICLVSVYGGKVLANIKKKPTKKTVSKKETETEIETETDDWKGNPNYFQTGKKAGQLKPKK
jgi:hypothetical protein